MTNQWPPLVAVGLAAAGFVSGWVDSIAGGGGLISVPALLATGLPTATVLGTNKVAASFGSSTSALRYGRAGHVKKIAWPMAALAFCASATGARLAIALPDKILNQIIVVALLVVTFITIFRRDFGKTARPWRFRRRWYALVACCCALSIGFYDGLIGPGTGSFLAFSFVALLGADFLSATGSTKVINFSTNLAAALLFAIGRHVDWLYALPMGLGILAGAYVGSGMALRNGSRFIRPIFVGVALALGVKLVLSLHK
ncbi:MAG: TSUP family transporter [Abitibacteriaceae bacterium]|nr:TSUP family transporter [Abditibacteriaceae bacterium]